MGLYIAMAAVIALVLGVVIGVLLGKNKKIELEIKLKTLDDKIIELNKSNEEAITRQKKEAKKELNSLKNEYEVTKDKFKMELERDINKRLKDKNKKRKKELDDIAEKLRRRETNLDGRIANFEKKELNFERKEENLSSLENSIKERKLEAERAIEIQKKEYEDGFKKRMEVNAKITESLELEKQKILKELENISGMTLQEAKDLMFSRIKDDVKRYATKKVQKMISEMEEVAHEKAQKIMGLAIQRYAGEYVAEKTVSVVTLTDDAIKGRIIGREGRNIRSFESVTGVDLIIDETPQAVVLSSFNPVRREIAKISLERLIKDGRIHPARIEEIVGKVENEIGEGIIKKGKEALMELNILPNMNPEMIKLIGTLKYRTSYGQNIWQHSVEVGFLCGVMAQELGLDVNVARRAGLLHDVGKAVDHEVEGSHAVIGANLARKYGESEDIIHAIEAHHNDVPPETTLAFLVDAADALSGARPGARRETMETFVKRLEDIENICNTFSGVHKTFAIQAGREVRVIVENDIVSEEDAVTLSIDIAKKIEENVTYPGQIKVVVIRERRVIAYAS